jgi:hypothetical protein
MNRPQIRKVAGVILLVFGLQLFCGLRLYAQHADLAQLPQLEGSDLGKSGTFSRKSPLHF